MLTREQGEIKRPAAHRRPHPSTPTKWALRRTGGVRHDLFHTLAMEFFPTRPANNTCGHIQHFDQTNTTVLDLALVLALRRLGLPKLITNSGIGHKLSAGRNRRISKNGLQLILYERHLVQTRVMLLDFQGAMHDVEQVLAWPAIAKRQALDEVWARAGRCEAYADEVNTARRAKDVEDAAAFGAVDNQDGMLNGAGETRQELVAGLRPSACAALRRRGTAGLGSGRLR